MPSLAEQLSVRAFFDDFAVAQHNNAVRALHSGEAVRDKHAGGLL